MVKNPLIVDIEESKRIKFEVDWVDTNTFIPNEEGSLESAGTSLLLNTSIVYLKYLSNDQLELLRQVVVEAVDHELGKRCKK